MNDLLEAYARAHGWALKEGWGATTGYMVFMPYFFMDAAYQAFLGGMGRAELRQRDRASVNRMREAFHTYFRRFRAMLTPDQQDYLLEVTDEFEAMIPRHLLIAQVQYMNCIDALMDYTRQRVSADWWTVNLLAGVAQSWYGEVHPRSWVGSKREDPQIGCVCVQSRDLNWRTFFPGATSASEATVTDRKAERMEKAVETLINSITVWVKERSAR